MESNENGLTYLVRIEGYLQDKWIEWLNGSIMDLRRNENGRPETGLMISVPDQAALRGILNKIWDLNLFLILVQLMQVNSSRRIK